MIKKISPSVKSFLFFFAAVFCGAVVGFTVYLSFSRLHKVSTLFYVLYFKEFSEADAICFIIPFSLLFTCLYLFYAKYTHKASVDSAAYAIIIAYLPVLLLIPVIFSGYAFYTLIAFLVIIPVVVFRVVLIFPKSLKFSYNPSRGFYLTILAAVTSFFIVLMIVFQIRIYNSLYLDYWDWGTFLNVVDNTLKGNWFFSDNLNRNFMAEHFQPGAVFLLAPVLMLFRHEYTIFIINALFLYSSGIIIYMLAIKKGIPRFAAFVISLAFLLCPSVSNMCTANYYGFHLLYMAIPVICFVFLLYEAGYLKTAFFLFLFSLTIKETLAVFWLAAGIVFIFGGKRKIGISISLISAVYYFVTAKLIMPNLYGYHGFMFKYGALGNTYMEIILSPFRRPDVFFEMLFRMENIYLLLLIFLPVFIVVPVSPLLLFSGSILYLFVCIQDSTEANTNFIHHQTEIIAVTYITLVYAYKTILEKGKNLLWTKILLLGIYKAVSQKNNLSMAILFALMLSALLNFYFFSISCIPGKNKYNGHFFGKDFSGKIEEMKTYIPKGISLSATSKISSHFILSNKVTMARSDYQPQEYILMDLCDPLSRCGGFETFRYRILTSSRYGLVYHGSENGRTFLILKQQPIAKFPEVVRNVSDGDWLKSGQPLEIEDPNFSIRYSYDTQNKKISLFLRLENKVNYDVFLRFKVIRSGKLYYDIFPFGMGFHPAYMSEKNDVYSITIPFDPGKKSEVRVDLEKRPVPDFSHTALKQ